MFLPCVRPSERGMNLDILPRHDHGFSRPLYWALRARRMAQRSSASCAAYDPCELGKDPYGRGAGSKVNVN